MSTEQNKALVRRLVDEVFNSGNNSVIDEITAVDFVEHEALPPGVPEGREALKFMSTMIRDAFPDFHVTIDDIIAEGDKVVLRLTWSGTQAAEWMGMPSSGNRFSITVIDIMRIADGRFVEHWGMMDAMGMMQQLGAPPA